MVINNKNEVTRLEPVVEQLLALQAQLSTLADEIYKLTDAYITALDKNAINASGALKRKYLDLIEKIDEYKAAVGCYKHILTTNAAFRDAQPDSLAARVAEQYTHGLVMRMILDEHRLTRPRHYVDRAITSGEVANRLLHRWAAELGQFSTFECT